MNRIDQFIEQVQFNAHGLVAAIAQDADSGEVLMMAWQNRQSLRMSLEKGEMVYFSRSRNRLWHKGESSGHTQKIHHIAVDCDGDAIVAKVTQVGGIACHTGRKSCFYRQYSADKGIVNNAEVIKSPQQIYGNSHE